MNSLNNEYGKKLSKTEIQYAPSSLRIVTHVVETAAESGEQVEYDITTLVLHPTTEEYLSQGWKQIVDIKPEEKEQYDIIQTDIEETMNSLQIIYEYEYIPRKFSRMKLKINLSKLGLLQQVKQILQTQEIGVGYSAWDAFEDCTYVSEDFEGYESWKKMIQQQLHLSDEQVEEILKNSLFFDN